MAKSPEQRSHVRRIVGFSLSPKMAGDVKAEAGRRGISLKKLFEEIWQLYNQQPDNQKPPR
ncbi:hypothetical protein FJ936_30120 [Mesorhizobium sp. B2-4-13]|uniref:hypothetical protein n=1 Tax=Mesorhizobium sp. B2-4-13 TaxID=2589936 RepID=UPI00115287C1|nr:hypothetical protein [Mesorhizobium sp. B2-4-13]TPK79038.1 hypothetical protein FJ936_30120 [Mesorhizobium sp. B2-4-13]